jgi:hypothetical protein
MTISLSVPVISASGGKIRGDHHWVNSPPQGKIGRLEVGIQASPEENHCRTRSQTT